MVRSIYCQYWSYFVTLRLLCFLIFPFICREMLAKAKRLARFKTELKENVQSSPAFADQKVSAHRNVQSMVERDKDVGNQSPEFRGDFTNANALSDYDGSEQSSVIIGLCPDMCPGISLDFLIYEQSCDSQRFNCDHFLKLGFLLIGWCVDTRILCHIGFSSNSK